MFLWSVVMKYNKEKKMFYSTRGMLVVVLDGTTLYLKLMIEGHMETFHKIVNMN